MGAGTVVAHRAPGVRAPGQLEQCCRSIWPKSKRRITHGIRCFCDTKSRYRDLDALLDYREYDGEWTAWFEENWLKPLLKGASVANRASARLH